MQQQLYVSAKNANFFTLPPESGVTKIISGQAENINNNLRVAEE